MLSLVKMCKISILGDDNIDDDDDMVSILQVTPVYYFVVCTVTMVTMKAYW